MPTVEHPETIPRLMTCKWGVLAVNREILVSRGDSGHVTQNQDCQGQTGTSGCHSIDYKVFVQQRTLGYLTR